MDVVQVGPREAVVQHDGTYRPAQQGQDDQRLEPPEPSRRVNQRGQNNSPQHVAHHRDNRVVEQVGRARELRLGVGGFGNVAVDRVAELAVEDRAREQQPKRHTPRLPQPAAIPLATRGCQVVDSQPEGSPDGEAQEEIARENPQVLLERVRDASFEEDRDEFGDDQHDHRGQPRRPA